MAYARDVDVYLWLHNKLGSGREPWTGRSISCQLSPTVLRNIKECFKDLDTQVKIKFLMSIFHFSRKNLGECKRELQEILEIAVGESEPWVAILAEMMKPYPSSGCLNLEPSTKNEESMRIFQGLVAEVTAELAKAKDLNLLPMEYYYLNKNALATVIEEQKPPTEHFSIKRKTKSEVLRAELLQKAANAAKINLKKIPAPAIPVRTRGMPMKMTDITPFKGIGSQISSPGKGRQKPVKGSSSQAPSMSNLAIVAARIRSKMHNGTKESGVKVIEITEQPVSRQQKRLKKQYEKEESEMSIEAEEKVVFFYSEV